jgi:hypothetical protein
MFILQVSLTLLYDTCLGARDAKTCIGFWLFRFEPILARVHLQRDPAHLHMDIFGEFLFGILLRELTFSLYSFLITFTLTPVRLMTLTARLISYIRH